MKNGSLTRSADDKASDGNAATQGAEKHEERMRNGEMKDAGVQTEGDAQARAKEQAS